VNRQTARVIVVALLAVVALGFASATLPSAVGPGDGGGGGGAREMANRTVVGGGGFLPEDPANRSEGEGDRPTPGSLCVPFLQSQAFLGGGLLVLLGGFLYARRRFGSTATTFAVFAAALPLLAILYAVFASCGPGRQVAPDIPTVNLSRTAEALSGGAVRSSPDPPLLVLVVLAAAVGVLGFVLLRESRGGVESEVEVSDSTEEETLAAIGETAGEAADRIESATDTDNEVYRAWREMAALLDVQRPETSTPGEFRAAAVGAGMESADVSELTELFEAVRYGDAPPTEEREQRAVAALRRIEAEHGGPTAEYDDGGEQ
jgi:hypothetical protein